MSAFANAFDDLFADPNVAVTIRYQGRPVRALVRRPDRDVEFSDIAVHVSTAVFEVLRREVPEPQAGDIIVHDEASFIVQGEPHLDAERLIWTIDTRPA